LAISLAASAENVRSFQYSHCRRDLSRRDVLQYDPVERTGCVADSGGRRPGCCGPWSTDRDEIGAAEALRAANRKALVVGINASREVIDFIKSDDVLGSGDYNGFDQGCLATEIAIRNLRKQPIPNGIILKLIVMDITNYQDYETPMEQRRSDSGQRGSSLTQSPGRQPL
jgi:hypothetical protein